MWHYKACIIFWNMSITIWSWPLGVVFINSTGIYSLSSDSELLVNEGDPVPPLLSLPFSIFSSNFLLFPSPLFHSFFWEKKKAHHVAQASPELAILLHLPSWYWDYLCVIAPKCHTFQNIQARKQQAMNKLWRVWRFSIDINTRYTHEYNSRLDYLWSY